MFKIAELRLGPLVRRFHDPLDQEERSSVSPHVPEDPDAILVVPVVDDPLEEIRVAAFGHGLEEAPADDRATLSEVDPFDDVRLVEEQASELWVLVDQCPQEGSVTAADVHDRSEPPEVVRVDQRADHELGARRHRPVEDLALLRVLRAVLPDADPVREPERVLPRADALLERGPGVADVAPPDERGPARHRFGSIRPERIPRSVRENRRRSSSWKRPNAASARRRR